MSEATLEASLAQPAGRAWRHTAGTVVALAWPAVLLVGAFAIPAMLLLRVGFSRHDASGLWSGGFTLASYAQLFDRVVAGALTVSVLQALACATLCVAIGFPLAYAITRMGRRAQLAWLILLLSTLTLSEVLITFSWQVMLSKRVGLSTVLVRLGLMDEPDSLAPSVGAVIACLVYLVLPFTVLTLYPSRSRLDRDLVQAARTLGASPLRAFTSVIVPVTRGTIVSAFVLAVVLTLGSYVAPLVLGPARDWTLAILITRTALGGQDLPGAVALAMLLLTATLGLGLVAARFGRHRRGEAGP